MSTILENFLTYNLLIIYSILFLLIFLENTVPFVPGDAVLIFSAYLAGRGSFYPFPTFLITVFGSLTGFVFIFLVSRYWRGDIYRKLPIKISKDKIYKYKKIFQRHENWSLLIGRIIPGSRLFLSVSAGFADIPFNKACSLTILGILIWNGIIFRAGVLLGKHWEIVRKTISEYSAIVNILLIIVMIWLIVRKFIWPKIRINND